MGWIPLNTETDGALGERTLPSAAMENRGKKTGTSHAKEMREVGLSNKRVGARKNVPCTGLDSQTLYFVQKNLKKVAFNELHMPNPSISPPQPADLTAWADAINGALKRYSDKDWNYSRILLTSCVVGETSSPYVLMVDWIDVRGKKGAAAYKNSQDEVTWGGRHSHELGILEVISLRLNLALSQVTTADYWHGVRPVVRLQKRSALIELGQTHAFWYRVEEVQGEEFENR